MLRIKFGIDPTAQDVHLGHVVPIMILDLFSKAGHHIDLIIGDFTAQIGDPTERTNARVVLTPEKVVENMQNYIEQIRKYVNMETIAVHYNSNWLSPLSLKEIFTLFQRLNLNEVLQREDFRERMRNAKGVTLAEICYGILMGLDSVHLKTQIEVGGIDQLLNFQQCRKVMEENGLPAEIAVMTPVLEGISGDGRKMSKSYGNYIAINESAEEKFGKIMSIPDRLVSQYFRCFAIIQEQELIELDTFITSNPLEAKKQLATLIIATETRNIEDGLRERESFERRFSQKEIHEEDCIEIMGNVNTSILEALIKSGKFKSRNELRRLFDQKAVRSKNGISEHVLSPDTALDKIQGFVRVGKHRLFKVSVSKREV
jgi:tyrosyl-tRNA synthetase